MSDAPNLNAEFSRALGLPRYTTKATLTLEVNEPPMLSVQCLCIDSNGRVEFAPDADAIRKIAFSYRLVPFGAHA